MVINTNIPSAYASRILSGSTNNLAKSLAKLSSGSRIVSPEDDAAGLAQSMKFGAEIGRIGAARSNVGNAISFSQTQDGFLSKIDSALRRMSELATLSADQTKAADDVANYEKEFAELKSFITKSSTKTFNSVGLFSASTLADKELGTNDALIKTQYDTLTTDYNTWVGDPADVSGTGLVSAITATTADVFTSGAAHGMTTGEKVNFVSKTAGSTTGTKFDTTTDAAYVKFLTATTFELYEDSALTTKVDVTTAYTAAVIDKQGNYSKLTELRNELGNMAQEWYQKERGTDTAKVAYASDATGNTAWADVYDFWQTRTNNSWTGVRAHADGYTTAQAANHLLHVGNAGAVSDTLIEGYKKMVSDVKSYVNNNGAGLEVTDASDATTFQLKGADVSTITSAISSATDTNTLNAAMTKTNAADYVSRINTLINNLAGSRAYVGANISRLNMVESQLAVYGENLSAANSRIADVDVATESANYAKQQILVQSGTAMLAQANVLSQSALKLL
jgi:flagellin